jgi:hypothetical protein
VSELSVMVWRSKVVLFTFESAVSGDGEWTVASMAALNPIRNGIELPHANLGHGLQGSIH